LGLDLRRLNESKSREKKDDQKVVDTFEQPGRQLRGERDLLFFRDEVGPHDFARTANEHHRREPDCGSNE
jgi:hypothetical protein